VPYLDAMPLSPDLRDVDAVVCDLDGVIYRGKEPVEGSPEAVAGLRDAGLRVLFCTNNAHPTVDEYVRRLGRMGIECAPEELVTSSIVAGEVLARDHPGAHVFVVGGPGLHEAIESKGLTITRAPHDAGVVVVGIDPTFDYDAMDVASMAVRNGARFYATNDDATYPAEKGLRPGAGAIVGSIEIASGTSPLVLGKPHRPMMEAVVRRLQHDARIAMVGDRPETDLAGAREMGWKTILVLSGVTDADAGAKLDPQPDLLVERLASLVS
jgi:4-nitrophenyl phosphatase